MSPEREGRSVPSREAVPDLGVCPKAIIARRSASSISPQYRYLSAVPQYRSTKRSK